MSDQLTEAVKQRQQLVKNYLNEERNRIHFTYPHLEMAVYSYVNAGGKSLRAAVMMLCCGAVGGDEHTALPAAAAIELYHTFTLVHDDIIDRDELRRGIETVHTEFSRRGREELHFDPHTAEHYGLTLAILAGDMQQGWAASLFPDLTHRYNVPAEVALNLIYQLFRHTQVALINGETIDVLQARAPIDKLSEHEVLEMLRQKTGVLYEFAGRAGAAIGLRQPDFSHPTIQALANFTGKCGIAFQVQDDILGVIGNEKQIGKTVGSDIREGKRTVIVLHSYKNMTPAERDFTLSVLGNEHADRQKINELIALLQQRGGVRYAQSISEQYIAEAKQSLADLPDSLHKSLLLQWADYIIQRDR